MNMNFSRSHLHTLAPLCVPAKVAHIQNYSLRVHSILNQLTMKGATSSARHRRLAPARGEGHRCDALDAAVTKQNKTKQNYCTELYWTEPVLPKRYVGGEGHVLPNFVNGSLSYPSALRAARAHSWVLQNGTIHEENIHVSTKRIHVSQERRDRLGLESAWLESARQTRVYESTAEEKLVLRDLRVTRCSPFCESPRICAQSKDWHSTIEDMRRIASHSINCSYS